MTLETVDQPNTHAIDINELQSRLTRFNAFLKADPDNLNLLAEVSDISTQLGELDLARQSILHALESVPDDPYFKLRLSTVALTENKLEESIAITSDLLAKGLDDAAIRFNHAFALVRQQCYEEAKPFLIALYNEQVNPQLVPKLLIRTHHYLEELEEAIKVANEHLEIYPQDAEVIGMLSLLYFDDNDLTQAHIYGKRALETSPNNPDALMAASGAALGLEHFDEARILLEQAVKIDPPHGRAWVTLGLMDMLDSNLEAAQKSLHQAVKYMPDHIGSWHVLAWSQLLSNDIAAAEASFLTALKLDENFGETHGGLAVIAAMRGQWDKAEEFSKVARRLDPASMSAQYVKIIRLQHEGQGDVAERVIQSVLKSNKMPSGGSLFEFLGRRIRK